MSINRKIAIISIVATVLPALALAYTGIPAGFTFTKNLSSGMHDADVVYLKTILANEACVSGLANTDYFASKTKAGAQCFCNKYKAEISTAAGYTVGCSGLVGTGMRSKLNALIAGEAPVPGATPTPTPSAAAEGTYTITLSATPVSRTTNGGSGIEVYGFDVTARGSDITIGKIDLQTAVAAAGIAMSPSTLITAIKIYDTSVADANLKATITNPVFTLDPNAVYYTSLTSLNFLVPKDQTKKLLIVFDTSTAFDVNRVVTVNIYGNNGIRGRDTMGIDTYQPLAVARVITMQRPGNAVLTLSTSELNPDSQNLYSDATVGVQTAQPVLVFKAKATAGNATFVRLELTYGASAGSEAIPNILYMYAGDTLVASATPNFRAGVAVDRVAVFTNFQSSILQDQTVSYTIKAAWPVIASRGNNFFTPSIPAIGGVVANCAFMRADGSTVACTGAAVEQGNTQRLFEQGVKLALVSTSITTTPIATTQDGGAAGVIKFTVQPFGGTMTQIIYNSGNEVASFGSQIGSNVVMEAYWASSAELPLGASPTGPVISKVIAQSPARNLNDGEIGTVTATYNITTNNSYGAGTLRFRIDGVHWVVGAMSIYEGARWLAENGVGNFTDTWVSDWKAIQ